MPEQRQVQKWYDTATAATMLGRAAYTVRDWCRLGRVRAARSRWQARDKWKSVTFGDSSFKCNPLQLVARTHKLIHGESQRTTRPNKVWKLVAGWGKRKGFCRRIVCRPDSYRLWQDREGALSIRFKMTTIAVAVILVANSLLSFLTVQYLGHIWLGEVQTRVGRNLRAARAAYQNRLDLIEARLATAARDHSLAAAVRRRSSAALAAPLDDLLAAAQLDFVTLVGPTGTVLCRARGKVRGDDLSTDPLVAEVLRQCHAAKGTTMADRRRLLVEGGDLAERACIKLLPTPAARPTERRVCTEGMLMAAAVPVFDGGGRMLAVLCGGNLLNHSYEIVDAIQREVFLQQAYNGKEVGTVTIFLGDVRVSTDVKLDDGSRAVGTRLSGAVCERVLDRGDTWAAPAFVVNDWYITAYEPISDPAGQIIGALYVGLLRPLSSTNST